MPPAWERLMRYLHYLPAAFTNALFTVACSGTGASPVNSLPPRLSPLAVLKLRQVPARGRDKNGKKEPRTPVTAPGAPGTASSWCPQDQEGTEGTLPAPPHCPLVQSTKLSLRGEETQVLIGGILNPARLKEERKPRRQHKCEVANNYLLFLQTREQRVVRK